MTATAAATHVLPFRDDVRFGPRWSGGFPFTYRQQATVVVDDALAYTQVVEATCEAPGAPAVVASSEGVGPTPPAPGDPGAEPGGPGDPVPPRFAG